MNESVKQRIKAFILSSFLPDEDPAALTDDLELISGGVLDSISTLKLVSFLEETFDIQIEAHETDREHLDTLNQMTALVVSKTS